jgi:hypothetical protein
VADEASTTVTDPSISSELGRQIASTCHDCQLLVRRVADLSERVEKLERRITSATLFGVALGTALSQLAERVIAHL